MKVLITGIQSYLAIWPSKIIVWLAIGTAAVLAGATFLGNWVKAGE